MVLDSAFKTVLSKDEIKVIKADQAEHFANELALRYDILDDEEGRRLLNKLCIACMLVGAKGLSEALPKAMDNYLSTGKTGYEL